MRLHQLQPIHKSRNKKRIARGGKRGTTSGRGQKGQKSRAGAKIRPAEQDLIIRIPKRRGVKNKSFMPKAWIINVGDLDKKFDNQQPITKKSFKEKRVKILGEGEIKKAFIIDGLELSQKAKEKILAAGGTIK
jgi:large subunit ribosomal protein L15